jgi:hypothetical protein
MAKFNVTAAAINASIEKTKMSFTEDGLEIIDGGFAIKESTGQFNEADEPIYNQLLGFESNKEGRPKLTVRGAIYATEGEFTGSIKATDASF